MPRPKKSSVRVQPAVQHQEQQEEEEEEDLLGGGLIQDTADHYEEVSVIGSGAYGTVYKARDLANEGQFVALKKVRVPLTEEGVPLSTLREIALLRHIEAFDHPNVVRLLDICHGPRLEQEQQLVLYLVFEHVDQDLASYLEGCPQPGMPPEKIRDISHQLLCGVDFLHCNRIVHRDLKPQNILITNAGLVKVADFGLARIFERQMPVTSVVVTLWYRAPEVLLQCSYASAVDVWSCACILAELYRTRPLFRGQSEVDQLRKIFEVLGCPEEEEWPDVPLPWTSFRKYRKQALGSAVPEASPDALDLMQRMFVFNPLRRISAKDAIDHAYFRDVARTGAKYEAKRPKRAASSATEPGVSAKK